jgi:hypothetical protein
LDEGVVWMKSWGRSYGQFSMQLLVIMALLFAFISIFIWQIYYLAEKTQKGILMESGRQSRETNCFVLGELKHKANGALIIEGRNYKTDVDKNKIELVDCN